MEEESIPIHLISNSDATNTSAEFRNKLAQSIRLDEADKWSVALLSMSFNNTIKTITNDSATVKKYSMIEKAALREQPLNFTSAADEKTTFSIGVPVWFKSVNGSNP